jgi:hypothetical protein
MVKSKHSKDKEKAIYPEFDEVLARKVANEYHELLESVGNL